MKETMDAEVFQVAREAVAALQQPHWAEVAQPVVSSGGLERFTIGCSLAGVGVLCPRVEGWSEAASLFPPGGYTES